MIVIAIPAYQPGQSLVELLRDLRGLTDWPIVVVDDGSRQECWEVFEAAGLVDGVKVLRHAVNLGKGAALKTAFNHALCEWPEAAGVVTADADGQHLTEDILAVAERLEEERDALVLGARQFGGDVPLRSQLGNRITRGVMRIVAGQHLNDTQTGLRGVPRILLPYMLRIVANGYDFELDMLLVCKHRDIRIVEEPIQTIYIAGNRSSHFNPLTDSLKIYFTLLRFSIVSIITTVIDNSVFFVLTHPLGWIVWHAQVVARLAALLFNYRAAQRAVFLRERGSLLTFLKFLALVVVSGTLSYTLMMTLRDRAHFALMPAKLTAETLLFFVNFLVQRDFIFASRAQPESVTQDPRRPTVASAPKRRRKDGRSERAGL
jgi:glycosyltransferase involved in cell wall biosynthesis